MFPGSVVPLDGLLFWQSYRLGSTIISGWLVSESVTGGATGWTVCPGRALGRASHLNRNSSCAMQSGGDTDCALNHSQAAGCVSSLCRSLTVQTVGQGHGWVSWSGGSSCYNPALG